MKRWFAAATAVLLLAAFSLHASAHAQDGGYSCSICSVQRSGHAPDAASFQPRPLAAVGDAPSSALPAVLGRACAPVSSRAPPLS